MVEVEVEFDYNAQEHDELTIKKGEVIKNVIKKPGGWWEGTLNGKTGVFPDNYVKPYDKNKVVLRNKQDATRIRQCRVVYSYTQEHEDELSLKTGQLIKVIGEEEEGWWRGILNGKEGVFPSNFVEEIRLPNNVLQPKPSARLDLTKTTDTAPALPAKPVRPQCQARFSYDAQNNDELSIKEGDIITIISKEECDQGWWKGELNGKIGVFPDNFVLELPFQSEHKNVVSPSSKVESKPAAADPSAIKPVSVASNRKLLDPKVTPPLPGKKPATLNQKKSPPASGGGILSKIKDKIVDVVDGATGSKSKTEPPKEKTNIPDEFPVTQTFDEVSRRPLLSDVRANRARAPNRRLPTSIYKEDDEEVPGVPNGTTDHSKLDNSLKSEDSFKSDRSASSETLDSSDLDASGESKPKLREWEKHKAPWLAEMKLNQAKRTSVSPVPEPKPKSQPIPVVDAKSESKSGQNSPAEREILVPDMSKSMSDMKLSPMEVKPIPKPYRAPPVDADKAPLIKSSLPREPLPKPIHQPQTKPKVEAPNTQTAISTEKSQSSIASLTNKTSEKLEEKVVTVAKFNEVLERLANLEIRYEQQHQMIEDLRNRLQVETDMRMLLQEKVMHNNVQV